MGDEETIRKNPTKVNLITYVMIIFIVPMRDHHALWAGRGAAGIIERE